MRRRSHILLPGLALLVCCACGNSTLETTFNSQSTKIETYVDRQLESHPEYRAVYDEGVVRLVIAEGEGEELTRGGKATFYYAGYNFNNTSISASVLFATNDADVAASAGWNLPEEDTLPLTVTLGKDDLVPGLAVGLKGVRAGEDCYIMFSGKYGFGKHQIGTIPANAALCYHVRIEDVEP